MYLQLGEATEPLHQLFFLGYYRYRLQLLLPSPLTMGAPFLESMFV